MSSKKNIEYISYYKTIELIQSLDSSLDYELNVGKKQISLLRDSSAKKQVLTLPSTFPEIESNELLDSYRERVTEDPPPQLIIMVQAGAASLGFFEGEIFYHKVITKYMVRKGQGKAQITYAKQKGKSRLGSRIRLQQGILFFKEINEKLHEWSEEIAEVEKIFVSCPIRLMNEIYSGKTNPPFLRNDPRISKIPFSTHKPSYKELKRIHYILNAGVISSE